MVGTRVRGESTGFSGLHAGLTSRACDDGPSLKTILCLVSQAAVAFLKFFIIFEEGALHFHSMLGPDIYVASSVFKMYC